MSDSRGGTVAAFLLRELGALRRELEAYPDEATRWERPAGLPNSAGTLTLHLCGNLRHYVGAVLGGDDYTRDREFEFAGSPVPLTSLLEEIAAAEESVRTILPSLPDSRLNDDFPEPIRDLTLTIEQFLLQLAVHLAFHLGQVDYHRRSVTGDPSSVNALASTDLLAILKGGPA